MEHLRPQQSILARMQEKGHVTMPNVILRSPQDTDTTGKASAPERTRRYDILGEVAAGGVGVVLRARDVDVGRDVAIKVLHTKHLKNAELVERLIGEAQIGGQLQHPGIVPVYELGLDERNIPYFSMKLVKGETLTAKLQARKSTADGLRDFLSIFEQVCHTMAYAHARGVIHRDLKPSNIMVGAYGEVLVLDWGFGKVLARGGVADEKRATIYRDDVTRIETVRSAQNMDSISGSVMGTPAYMPPEQALGNIEDLDKRSDVFSLGAILCEILTGSPPYGTDPQNVLLLAAQGNLTEAAKLLEECAGDQSLASLCKSCLEPLRKDRPQDAGALAAAVGKYLAESEERARRLELEVLKHRRRTAKAKADAAAAHAAAEAARTAAKEDQALAEQAREDARAARDAAIRTRRARRQVIAIAAMILVGVVLAGGVYSWSRHTRSERARDMRARVDRGLTAAQDLRAQGKLAEAVVAARQASDLAGQAEVDDETRTRATNVLTAIETAKRKEDAAAESNRRNRALLTALASCRARTSEIFDATKTDALYDSAFRAFGVNEKETFATPEAIKECPDSAAIVSALDDWSWLRKVRLGRPEAEWARPMKIAERADADPWRSTLRTAIVYGRTNEVLALARTDPSALPADSARLLAIGLSIAGERAEALKFLRKAELVHDGDPWILSLLCTESTGGDAVMAEAAVRSALAAASLAPHVLELRVQLAYVEMLAGADRTARSDCEQVLRAAPEFPEAHVLRASILERTRDMDGAVGAWRRAIELDPKSSELQRRLAATLLRTRDTAAALTAAKEAVRLRPNDPDTQLTLAVASLSAKDLSTARSAAKAVLDARPSDARAHHVLGLVFLEAGHLDDALAEMDQAAKLAPDDLFVQNSYGLLLLKRKDRVGANTAFTRAAQAAGPPQAAAQANLAALQLARGDLKEAVLASRDTTTISDPGAASSWDEGLTSSGKGPLDQVIDVLREVVRQNANYAFAHHRLAIALEKKGMYMDAISACKKALAVEPNYGYCVQTLAWIYMTCPNAIYRDPKAALQLAETLSRIPGHPAAEAAQTMGIARYRVGDYANAVDALENSVAGQSGGDAWDWYFLAMARWRLGDQKTARRWLAKAQAWTDENAPDDPVLKRFRAEAEELIKPE